MASMRSATKNSPQKACREATRATPPLTAAVGQRRRGLFASPAVCGSADGDISPLCSNSSTEAPVHPRAAAHHTATHSQSASQDTGVEEYDVLGLGQLMIDYAATVDDNILNQLQVPKGGRRIISVEEKAAVMERLQGYNSQVSAGGSLANSLVGIAQLAAARERFLAKSTTTSGSSNSSSGASSPAAAAVSPAAAQPQQQRLRVAMAGCCGGSDALGEYGRAQMTAAGVDIISVDGDSAPWAGTQTGTVMVFTTPDAQRSFLSSFSSEDTLHLTPQLLSAVSRSRLVVIEGYLWELPNAAEVLPAVVKHARAVGTLVVMTAGDASVVQRHGAKVLQAIQEGVDMYICNAAEAEALQQYVVEQQQQQASQQCVSAAEQQQLQHLQRVQEMEQHHVTLDPQGSASIDSVWDSDGRSNGSSSPIPGVSEGQVAACELAGVCPLVVVTDGSRGSYITALGQLTVVPPFWRTIAPVDTCGAGDAYCSGFLFAFLLGLDMHSMGHVAAKTASAVISRHGPHLQERDADTVAGVPLGRNSSLAAQFMGAGGGNGNSSNASAASTSSAVKRPLGLGVDAAAIGAASQ